MQVREKQEIPAFNVMTAIRLEVRRVADVIRSMRTRSSGFCGKM